MTWTIDSAHTNLGFSVTHMMLAKVRGEFEEFEGAIAFDPENPAETKVDLTIDVASLTTRNKDRDAHLRSPDFFDVEQYPAMTFKSKRVEMISDNEAKLVGDLTIKGITREVVLDVNYAGQAQSPWGTVNAGFTAGTTINRTDWGLTWNQALETGGVLVSEQVSINVETELVKQAEAEAEAV